MQASPHEINIYRPKSSKIYIFRSPGWIRFGCPKLIWRNVDMTCDDEGYVHVTTAGVLQNDSFLQSTSVRFAGATLPGQFSMARVRMEIMAN